MINSYILHFRAQYIFLLQSHITPLHLSAGLGHVDFVEFLVSEFVVVDVLDNQKR